MEFVALAHVAGGVAVACVLVLGAATDQQRLAIETTYQPRVCAVAQPFFQGPQQQSDADRIESTAERGVRRQFRRS
jgi:hypothetical protein